MARFPTSRRYRSRKAGLSGPAIVYALCLGLLLGWYAPEWRQLAHDYSVSRPAAPIEAPSGDRLSANFAFCHSGGGKNCVVDGDTFWFRGEKIRIADIDTPETHGPRCPAEAALGAQATTRLHDLLNAGAFSLESADRDTDRYGRRLHIVTRRGGSIGGQLVAEGLARPWEGARRSWCV
ncbi:MAG: thermonuclease family protein [Sphingobium sp.]